VSDIGEVTTSDLHGRLVRLARAVFAVPGAALTVRGERQPQTLVASGVGRESAAATEPVWRFALGADGVVVIPDLSASEMFGPGMFPLAAPTGTPPVRFYAGVPVRSASGEAMGMLAVFDHVPRNLDAVQRQILADLGAVLERELSASGEMAMAGEVQQLLLPREPPDVPGLEVAGRVLPARDTGGDFFDWHVVHDLDGTVAPGVSPGASPGVPRLDVVLGDVMGKGMAASLVASEMRAVLRTHARYVGVPEAVRRTAETTAADLASLGRFVTLWSASIEPSGPIEYVDAGHGLAVIASPRGPRSLTQDQLPLGMPVASTWTAAHDVLQLDELLVVVSDGVFDVFGSIGQAYDAVQELLAPGLTCADAVDAIIEHASAGGTSDDVAAVVVRRVRAD
jgi:serine phosphatase RsbU (regulator of sigma subunit)